MAGRNVNYLHRVRGFTIVEVVVILAVIGTLLTVVVMSFSQNAKRMSKNDAVASAEQVKIKLSSYFSEKQRYPAAKADVIAYLNSLSGSGNAQLASSFGDTAKYDYSGYTADGLACTTTGVPRCDKYTITVKATGWGGGASESNVSIYP